MVREHVLRLSRGRGMVNSRCLSPASRLRADPKEADAAAVAQAARLVGAAERRGQRRVVEEGWDRDGLLRRRLARCEDEPLHGCPASARGNASASPRPAARAGSAELGAESGEQSARRADPPGVCPAGRSARVPTNTHWPAALLANLAGAVVSCGPCGRCPWGRTGEQREQLMKLLLPPKTPLASVPTSRQNCRFYRQGDSTLWRAHC